MQLTLVAPGFYQITNVFDPELLSRLISQFDHTSSWETLTATSKNNSVRYQLGLQLNSELSQKIYQALLPVQIFAEHVIAHELYQNSPQLWEDTVGYINNPHYDISPNLVVNVQVYLSPSSVDNTGTCCLIDSTWHSVPYQYNSGYVMLRPTQVEHGMQHPVVDQRRSLYQSYRATFTAGDVW
jgi:hypothetical protein